jgi:hypothetical protein
LSDLTGIILKKAADSNRFGLSITSQLYFESSINPPNKQSICEARQKLCWMFFERLFCSLSEVDQQRKSWKSFQVKIIDGTKVRVPRTDELMTAFGSSSSQYGKSHYPTMNLVVLSDAFSTEPLGVEIGKYESSERELASKLFTKLSSKDLLLLDRGLGGKEVYSELHGKNISFVHRVQTKARCLSQVKEFLNSGKQSDTFILQVGTNDPQQIRLVLGNGLATEEPIVYATNLLDNKKYGSAEIHDLYKSRWQVETNIGHLKNTLGLEKIKSKTYNSVLQDIYAHLIVLSLAAKAEVGARRKLDLEAKKKALSIKFIISLIAKNMRNLCQSPAKKAWNLIVDLAKNIIWTRQPNRSYPRYSRQPQNSWSQERSYLKKGLKRKNSR